MVKKASLSISRNMITPADGNKENSFNTVKSITSLDPRFETEPDRMSDNSEEEILPKDLNEIS